MEERTPILVLVTMQRACARLIRTGADMALKQALPLNVLHVAVRNDQTRFAIEPNTLDYLYALAGEAGAEMCVLTAEVALTAIANYAQENHVKQIVMGGGEQAPGIAETLSRLLPGVQIFIINPEE
ncbi:MAG: hypothetical protein PHI98_14075 [Eubacteriales bacterium]|nr:hypothetical protein [Eubacteriales bacterium]